jgi:hypothetical protein
MPKLHKRFNYFDDGFPATTRGHQKGSSAVTRRNATFNLSFRGDGKKLTELVSFPLSRACPIRREAKLRNAKL